MKSIEPADAIETAAGILGQLEKYISQLAASENDPEVDVAALTEACGQRLVDLKSVLPRALKDRDRGPELARAAKGLEADIVSCSEVLQKARARAAKEIESISRSRRAIHAYGKRE